MEQGGGSQVWIHSQILGSWEGHARGQGPDCLRCAGTRPGLCLSGAVLLSRMCYPSAVQFWPGMTLLAPYCCSHEEAYTLYFVVWGFPILHASYPICKLVPRHQNGRASSGPISTISAFPRLCMSECVFVHCPAYPMQLTPPFSHTLGATMGQWSFTFALL